MATRTAAARFWSKVRKAAGDLCWEWIAFTGPTGYGVFRMWGGRNNPGKTERAHRAAWILTNGPIPNGLCVLHRCDNPRCVRPDHLFLGTQIENVEDRERKGRGNTSGFGFSSRHAMKLNAACVLEVKALLAAGQSQRQVARTLKVSQATIWRAASK